MKRIVIPGIMCVIILYGDVDWIKVTGSSDSPVLPAKLLMKSDSAGILIRVLIDGFCQEDTTVDNKDFKRLSLPDEEVDRDTSHTGKPQLPYVRLLFAVPDSCDFTINTNDNNLCSFLTDYSVYPMPEIVFQTDTFGCVGPVENYVYDASFYQTDTFFPGEMYTIHTDGYWRDQRLLEVYLYPLQYNPYLELLYVYTAVDLHITYQGDIYVKVKTLVDQILPAGTYNPVWYGKNDNFVLLPAGIYFIEIKVKSHTKIIPVEINR